MGLEWKYLRAYYQTQTVSQYLFIRKETGTYVTQSNVWLVNVTEVG
jgi:hypothetical protein